MCAECLVLSEFFAPVGCRYLEIALSLVYCFSLARYGYHRSVAPIHAKSVVDVPVEVEEL